MLAREFFFFCKQGIDELEILGINCTFVKLGLGNEHLDLGYCWEHEILIKKKENWLLRERPRILWLV